MRNWINYSVYFFIFSVVIKNLAAGASWDITSKDEVVKTLYLSYDEIEVWSIYEPKM